MKFVSTDDGKFKDGCCTSSDEPEVTPDEEVRTALESEEHSGEDNRKSLTDNNATKTMLRRTTVTSRRSIYVMSQQVYARLDYVVGLHSYTYSTMPSDIEHLGYPRLCSPWCFMCQILSQAQSGYFMWCHNSFVKSHNFIRCYAVIIIIVCMNFTLATVKRVMMLSRVALR